MKMNKFEYFLMTFDLGRHAYLRGIVKKLQGLSQLGSGKKILEIGCGNGCSLMSFSSPANLSPQNMTHVSLRSPK